MEWPTVRVLIVTYNRPKEIRQTLQALREHIVYDGQLSLHIADDGSPRNYLNDLQRDITWTRFTRSVTRRKGWGANVNKGLKACGDSFVFLCEDDYVARRDLDFNSGVALLLANKLNIGLIRYDGLAGHVLDLHLREGKTQAGTLAYAIIDPCSPHLGVYSNRPHLMHPRFHMHYGLYPEGRALGQTEADYAHRVKDRGQMPNAPALAILPEGILLAFDHIGRSWKGTNEDVHKR